MDTNPNSTRLHVTADVVIDRPDDAREVPSGAENALEITGRVTQARIGTSRPLTLRLTGPKTDTSTSRRCTPRQHPSRSRAVRSIRPRNSI
jgi:hypothetical protein